MVLGEILGRGATCGSCGEAVGAVSRDLRVSYLKPHSLQQQDQQ